MIPIVIIVIMTIKNLVSSSHNCPEHSTFKDKCLCDIGTTAYYVLGNELVCVPCLSCHNGTGMLRDCNNARYPYYVFVLKKEKCVVPPDGKYAIGGFIRDCQKPCNRKMNMVEVRNCTRYHNRLCDCDDNHYKSPLGRCDRRCTECSDKYHPRVRGKYCKKGKKNCKERRDPKRTPTSSNTARTTTMKSANTTIGTIKSTNTTIGTIKSTNTTIGTIKSTNTTIGTLKSKNTVTDTTKSTNHTPVNDTDRENEPLKPKIKYLTTNPTLNIILVVVLTVLLLILLILIIICIRWLIRAFIKRRNNNVVNSRHNYQRLRRKNDAEEDISKISSRYLDSQYKNWDQDWINYIAECMPKDQNKRCKSYIILFGETAFTEHKMYVINREYLYILEAHVRTRKNTLTLREFLKHVMEMEEYGVISEISKYLQNRQTR